jgi:hypothetical protein
MIETVRGDITAQDVDAVVNAANSSLLGGGGVDGAIHRKGGKAILDDCRKLRASTYGRGLPTGQAVATTAGRLPAKWVIHNGRPGVVVVGGPLRTAGGLPPQLPRGGRRTGRGHGRVPGDLDDKAYETFTARLQR